MAGSGCYVVAPVSDYKDCVKAALSRSHIAWVWLAHGQWCDLQWAGAEGTVVTLWTLSPRVKRVVIWKGLLEWEAQSLACTEGLLWAVWGMGMLAYTGARTQGL